VTQPRESTPSPADPQGPPGPNPVAADPDEQDLVRAVRAAGRRGETGRSAWGTLLARYQDRVFAVCLRMVGDREAAADLAQDTFVKVIHGLDSYDGRSKLSTWIIRIAMNVCLSHLRSQKLRRHASLDAPAGGTDRPKSEQIAGSGRELEPSLGVEGDERRRIVSAGLADLPADQRAILILRDVQGLDYEQIADVLGVAVGTVKSRLFRARLALRSAVEARGLTPTVRSLRPTPAPPKDT
jgi:RNA polymerase sigma-70 factor, ECF subfamily